MNRDIVARLRDSQPDGTVNGLLLNDAADEIEALRYSLRLDEELIGMIQKIISRLNNRPEPN